MIIFVVRLATLALLLLSSLASGAVEIAESLNVGDTVSGAIKIGRRIVVLPAGDWQLSVKSERSSSTEGNVQAPTIMALFFQEIRDGRLNRMLELTATKNSGRVNWIDEPCKSKGDSYWMEDRKRGINDQFCLRIGFRAGIVDNARGEAFQAWARDIKAKSIGYSPEMPFVSVTRYTSYDYLQMTVSFDPSVSGIASSQNPNRQSNDWNGLKSVPNSTHAKFYDALVLWAPKFAEAVQRAFAGDEKLSDADFGAPVLPSLSKP